MLRRAAPSATCFLQAMQRPHPPCTLSTTALKFDRNKLPPLTGRARGTRGQRGTARAARCAPARCRRPRRRGARARRAARRRPRFGLNLSLVLNWFELGTLVNVLNFDCLHMLWFVCACASRRGVLACFLLLPGWLGCFGFCAAGRKKKTPSPPTIHQNEARTLPVQNTTRLNSGSCGGRGARDLGSSPESSMISRLKRTPTMPWSPGTSSNSSRLERHLGWRSRFLGAMTMSGLRNWRWTCCG